MPRVRKPPLSAFPTDDAPSPETQVATQSATLAGTQAAPDTRRASQDPLRFFRVIAEIERQRGLRVHPESSTRH